MYGVELNLGNMPIPVMYGSEGAGSPRLLSILIGLPRYAYYRYYFMGKNIIFSSTLFNIEVG